MKERQFLRVSYTASWGAASQDFKLSEARLINTVLKEIAVDGQCTVTLVTCDQDHYKHIFG